MIQDQIFKSSIINRKSSMRTTDYWLLATGYCLPAYDEVGQETGEKMSKINGDKKRSNLWSRKKTKMREKIRALRQEMNPAAKPSNPAKAS